MSHRVVIWYSCGAASAVAAKLALAKYAGRECVVAYCDTGSEHQDNERFLLDCERWLGVKILKLRSAKYTDTWDVFTKTRYLSGVRGARCTVELKKLVRQAFERPFEDIQVFGFHVGEEARCERFKSQNPEVIVAAPLLDAGLTKADCLSEIGAAGIEIPAMYRMGYRNNNCIGCVKGQAGYWNKIRRDFPEVFARMALMEREIGAAICKTEAGGKRVPIYLDELNHNAGRYEDLDISCGVLCEVQT